MVETERFNQLLAEEAELSQQIESLKAELVAKQKQRQAEIDALIRQEVLDFLGMEVQEVQTPTDVAKVTQRLQALKEEKQSVSKQKALENSFEAPLKLKAPQKNQQHDLEKMSANQPEEGEYAHISQEVSNRARSTVTDNIQKQYNLDGDKLFFDNQSNIFICNENKTRLAFTQPKTKNMPALRVDNKQRPIKASMWLVKSNLPRLSNKGPITTDPLGFAPGLTRGHLIARSMFNDKILKTKANKRTNLTPQTRWSNAVLQAEIEKEVLKAVRKYDNVRYQVEPMYHADNEVIPRCYHIQARSQNGKFKLNVVIPNIEPGYRLSYVTGKMTPVEE
ncbi:DNA/RNA non-specific endonuclease [Ligilactobacillus equi]|uniref:DNA/RNA non-specific endonuclease n=1 Tax=Ligilactobacillus equi TaxID=137357 RepID=UPI002ED35A92